MKLEKEELDWIKVDQIIRMLRLAVLQKCEFNKPLGCACVRCKNVRHARLLITEIFGVD